jgi:4-amino-4-deoxy-L-arabinose transferase-like glycosyltransferase
MLPRTSLAPLSKWGWLACAAVAILALLINPIGYIGGHNDDWRYLEAARCWVAGGPCLPANHWATRWPLLASIAATSVTLGESRAALGLAMLPWWIACIALLGWLGRMWVDRNAGLFASALLATTPVFTQSALQPNIDIVELALQLAALGAATVAYRQQSKVAALVAGLVAALAVQSRETSILFCAAAALAWLLLPRGRREILLWTLAGFGAAMAIEMVAYGMAAGDALFRYRIALQHGAVPTDELPIGFDLSQRPLFNPAYIANWRREMGIHWWWPVDPWLNLIASPRIGFTLVAGALLGATHWRWLGPSVRIVIVRATLLALLIALLIVYVLAIDPKPRVFLMLVALAALAAGASLSAAIARRAALVPMVAVALVTGLNLVTLTRISSTREYEILAARWADEHRGDISVDPASLSTLALVPAIKRLPIDGRTTAYKIIGGNEPCRAYRGRTIGRSAVIGGGQLCLQQMRSDRPRP